MRCWRCGRSERRTVSNWRKVNRTLHPTDMFALILNVGLGVRFPISLLLGRKQRQATTVAGGSVVYG